MKHIIAAGAAIGGEYPPTDFQNFHDSYRLSLPTQASRRAAALAIAETGALPRDNYLSQNILAMYWGLPQTDVETIAQSLYALKSDADQHTGEMMVSVAYGRLEDTKTAERPIERPISLKIGRITAGHNPNDDNAIVSTMGAAFLKSKEDQAPRRGIPHPRLSMLSGIMVSDGLTIRLGSHGIVQHQASKVDPSLLSVFEGSVTLRDDPERFNETATFIQRDIRIGDLSSFAVMQTIATYIGPRTEAKLSDLPTPEDPVSATEFLQNLGQIFPKRIEASRA